MRWIAESIRQEIEPARRVSFLDGRMRIGRGPGLRRIKSAEWSVPLSNMSFHPVARHQRLIAAEIHSTEHSFALIPTRRSAGLDIEEPALCRLLLNPICQAVLIGDVIDAN